MPLRSRIVTPRVYFNQSFHFGLHRRQARFARIADLIESTVLFQNLLIISVYVATSMYDSYQYHRQWLWTTDNQGIQILFICLQLRNRVPIFQWTPFCHWDFKEVENFGKTSHGHSDPLQPPRQRWSILPIRIEIFGVLRWRIPTRPSLVCGLTMVMLP